MKAVPSDQWRVDSREAAQCAALPTANHYPLATVLIVGYGNPLRSDDALGWHACKLLEREFVCQSAQIIACHQLTPELAEPLSQCRQAVFIDADATGIPGAIRLRTVRAEVPTGLLFTHTCTPSGLLAIALQLYGHMPVAILITVSGQCFELGDTLSPAVVATLPEVVAQACRWVDPLQSNAKMNRRS
jgi:hydrogenase maturation protease